MPDEKSKTSEPHTGKTGRSIVLIEDGEFSHPFLKKLPYMNRHLAAHRSDGGDDSLVVLTVPELERLLNGMEVLAQFANILRDRVDEYEKDLPNISLEELTASMRSEGKLPAGKYLAWEKQ